MLFDLRGRGRRRTVRVVYSGLALLFLLGFVGFGVGSFGGGGIAELFGEGKSNNETDYSSQLKKAKKLTEEQPNNPAAWSGLIHYAVLQSGTGANYIRSTTEEGFSPKAQPLLMQIQTAWQHYLKLNPHNPNPELAAEVLRIYSTGGGLSDPPETVKLLKIKIADQPPSATLEYELASAAYSANDVAEGDRAAKRALALAPAGERTILKNYLAKAKAAGSAQIHGTKAGTTSSGQTVTVPASSLPKGATSGQTVTVPASALPKGFVPKAGSTTGSVSTPTTTAPKK